MDNSESLGGEILEIRNGTVRFPGIERALDAEMGVLIGKIDMLSREAARIRGLRSEFKHIKNSLESALRHERLLPIGDNYFFLDQEGGPAMPCEMVDGSYTPSPLFTLLPLSELLHAPCPLCGNNRPVIRQHRYDHGIAADSGQLVQHEYVICCGKIQRVEIPELAKLPA